jgi:acetyl esterase/lipase
MVGVTACASADESSDTSPPSTEITTTSTAVETTTTSEAATSTSSVPEVARTDLLFMTQDGRELLADVYVPDGDGPFPVVVAFHGLPSDKNENRPVGRQFAESGFLTFVPTWLPRGAFTANPMPEDMLGTYEAATCILAYAQEQAELYGGDPSRTVTYGFSGGSQPAAWLGLGHTTVLAPGCVADQDAVAPVGAVLGDSEYFLHSLLFDHGFAADPIGMQQRVADFVDPATWPATLSAVFRIWSAELATFPRTINDAWDEDSWLAIRDPDGSIRSDLEDLGLLDDQLVSHIDEGILLTSRLARHGLDATHDLYPGGHESFDKLPLMADYIHDILATN